MTLLSLQGVEERCAERLRAAREELSARREEAGRAAAAAQDQNRLDRTELDRQQQELQERVETSRRLVQRFLQEELQQDVPTGESVTSDL